MLCQLQETLDLSGDQKREITQLRRMLLPKIQRLMKERGKLNLSSSPQLPSSVVGHRISLEYLKTHQMVGRLKEILSAEHKAMVEFSTTVIKKVSLLMLLQLLIFPCTNQQVHSDDIWSFAARRYFDPFRLPSLLFSHIP